MREQDLTPQSMASMKMIHCRHDSEGYYSPSIPPHEEDLKIPFQGYESSSIG
jgi:hypothetical protein